MKPMPSFFRTRPTMTSRLAWFASETSPQIRSRISRARDEVPTTLDDELDDGPLAGGQRDLHLPHPCAPGRDLDADVPRGQLGDAHHREAAAEGADPRAQLGDREGTREKVVGAGVEGLDPPAHRGPRGEDEDRRHVALGAHGSAPGDGVVRRVGPEEDGAEVGVLEAPRRLAAACGPGDLVLFPFEGLAEEIPELCVFLDDQEMHPTSPSRGAKTFSFLFESERRPNERRNPDFRVKVS